MLRKIIYFLSFPGVIFHELGHQIFCILTGTKVLKVCYFKFGDPSGYVIHDEPKNVLSSLLISTGPFISGTIFSIIFFLILKKINIDNKNIFSVLIWLGFSIAVNCFPSKEDAKNLFHKINKRIFKNPLVIIVYPIVLIIYIFEILSIFYLDLVYSIILYFLSINILYNII